MPSSSLWSRHPEGLTNPPTCAPHQTVGNTADAYFSPTLAAISDKASIHIYGFASSSLRSTSLLLP